jgi:hypothetical protein
MAPQALTDFRVPLGLKVQRERTAPWLARKGRWVLRGHRVCKARPAQTVSSLARRDRQVLRVQRVPRVRQALTA